MRKSAKGPGARNLFTSSPQPEPAKRYKKPLSAAMNPERLQAGGEGWDPSVVLLVQLAVRLE